MRAEPEHAADGGDQVLGPRQSLAIAAADGDLEELTEKLRHAGSIEGERRLQRAAVVDRNDPRQILKEEVGLGRLPPRHVLASGQPALLVIEEPIGHLIDQWAFEGRGVGREAGSVQPVLDIDLAEEAKSGTLEPILRQAAEALADGSRLVKIPF